MRQIRVPEIVLGLLLAVAIFAIGYSVSSQLAPYPQEQANAQNSTDSSAPAKEPDDKSFWIKATTDPVAAFTGVLAVTTVLLAVIAIVQIGFLIRADSVTRIAAAAAQRSADAAVRIELPVIKALPPSLEDRLLEQGALGEEYIYNSAAPNGASLVRHINFFNIGRTPAALSRVDAGWHIGASLPDSPVYLSASVFPDGRAVPEGGTYTLFSDLDFFFSTKATDTDAVALGQKTFWFFVAVAYKDFMGDPHEVGLCWVWQKTRYNPWAFVAEGNAPQQYTRKT